MVIPQQASQTRLLVAFRKKMTERAVKNNDSQKKGLQVRSGLSTNWKKRALRDSNNLVPSEKDLGEKMTERAVRD
jgi:hypothetical protein